MLFYVSLSLSFSTSPPLTDLQLWTTTSSNRYLYIINYFHYYVSSRKYNIHSSIHSLCFSRAATLRDNAPPRNILFFSAACRATHHRIDHHRRCALLFILLCRFAIALDIANGHTNRYQCLHWINWLSEKVSPLNSCGNNNSINILIICRLERKLCTDDNHSREQRQSTGTCRGNAHKLVGLSVFGVGGLFKFSAIIT